MFTNISSYITIIIINIDNFITNINVSSKILMHEVEAKNHPTRSGVHSYNLMHS